MPLIDFDDVCYDEHSDLLYNLAGQAVRPEGVPPNDDDAANVLQYHQRQSRLDPHSNAGALREMPVGYDAHVSKGFTTLRADRVRRRR